MRPAPWLQAEPFRVQLPPYETRWGDTYGAFVTTYARTGGTLRMLASDGRNSRRDFGDEYAWDHVSVSLSGRPPNWEEMCFVKSLFWDDQETVMQLHVPAADHINCHPNTLHLWKPLLVPVPRPPAKMV